MGSGVSTFTLSVSVRREVTTLKSQCTLTTTTKHVKDPSKTDSGPHAVNCEEQSPKTIHSKRKESRRGFDQTVFLLTSLDSALKYYQAKLAHTVTEGSSNASNYIFIRPIHIGRHFARSLKSVELEQS